MEFIIRHRVLIYPIVFFLAGWNAAAGLRPDIQYLFPLPGTAHHPPESVIIVRFDNLNLHRIANPEAFVSLTGDESGDISGGTVVSTDGKTLVFKPHDPFRAGETVTVRISPGGSGRDSVYSFSVGGDMGPPSRSDALPKAAASSAAAGEMTDPLVINGVSIPSDFPWTEITVYDDPDSGFIFISHLDDQFYNMILDHRGAPVWYEKTQSFGSDFKVQKNGLITVRATDASRKTCFFVMDSTYTMVDTLHAPPGYLMNDHDVQLLDGGHYLCIANDYRRMDLSGLAENGHPNALVTGNSVAEMDAYGNPVFIWRCWDHFAVTDAEHLNLTIQDVDYVHMNAVDVDLDGNILISSRHLSEVTKIDRRTGDILWRLGGVNNAFVWTNDSDGFSYQHDIRSLPNGHYTLFDNGCYHDPPYSRALEFTVDAGAGTATKVWEYRESPDRYTRFAGNVQRLPNGNTLINWAMPLHPKPTEVRPDGSKAFEMDFVNPSDCYRIFKFPWRGRADRPRLAIEPGETWLTLLFNQFGDPDVNRYDIYGGAEPHPVEVMAESRRPFIHLTDLTNHTRYYFRIRAVGADGEESPFSNECSILTQFADPEENLIRNGDFSQGLLYWDWRVTDARAEREITASGELRIRIQAAGADPGAIQSSQTNIPLIQNRTYRFEFDGRAEAGRTAEFEIVRGGELPVNYSRMGPVWLDPAPKHFSHEFVMDHTSEPNARIVLNTGASEHDVIIDNVSLRQVPASVSEEKESRPEAFRLFQNYPNPFNPETRIRYVIPDEAHVTLSVYNIRGEVVRTLVDHTQPAGEHVVRFHASGLGSGVYYYRLTAAAERTGSMSGPCRKMLIIK